MRINFEEVRIKHTFRYTTISGKKRQETKTFFQTINPFNKDVDGNVKTREQIYAELKVERDRWIVKMMKEHP